MRTPRTHCPKGHALTEDNVLVREDRGTRECRTCRREQSRAHYERTKVLKPKGTRQKVSDREFTEKHTEGLTAPQLAEHFGIAVSTVRKYRQRLGLKQATGLDSHRKARIASLLDEGLSVKDVHRITGVSQETIHRHFPGRGWSKQQIGQYSAMSIRLEQIAA